LYDQPPRHPPEHRHLLRDPALSIATQEVFERIWKTGRWASDGVHRSGTGTSLEYTANLRRELPKVIARHGIASVFDAPCGDLNWMQTVDLGEGVEYLGGDIVPEIVAENQRHFPDRDFCRFDLTEDELPEADLLLCRFCLCHLSYADIAKALRLFFASEIKYLMLTSHPAAENCDIETGGFRMLNMSAPPFSFGPALEAIDDWIEPFPRCQLLMWKAKR
jgi:hypothetical protein